MYDLLACSQYTLLEKVARERKRVILATTPCCPGLWDERGLSEDQESESGKGPFRSSFHPLLSLSPVSL